MQPIVLDESTLRRLLDMPSAIAAVRGGFERLWRGEAEVPVRTALEDARGSTLFMPGRLGTGLGTGRGTGPGEGSAGEAGGGVGGEVVGLKVVTVRPGNRERGLPAIHALMLLMDPETGVPAALLDAEWLTALRTGAGTGVATDLLARPDAETLAVVGAGAQARCQVEAVAAVRALGEVRIVSRTGESARRLAAELVDEGVVSDARGGSDARRAVAGADIVVTVTDSHRPVIEDADVAPGTHVNAVGGYRTDMQELPTALMARARVVVDEVAAALAEAGDVTHAVEAGVLDATGLVALGAVVAGARPGRRDPGEVTVFKSVGNAVQDLAVAQLALERSRT